MGCCPPPKTALGVELNDVWNMKLWSNKPQCGDSCTVSPLNQEFLPVQWGCSGARVRLELQDYGPVVGGLDTSLAAVERFRTAVDVSNHSMVCQYQCSNVMCCFVATAPSHTALNQPCLPFSHRRVMLYLPDHANLDPRKPYN